MSYILGVDIGASTVKLGLLDEGGLIVGSRIDAPSRASEGPSATMEAIAATFETLMAGAAVERSTVRAVGACSPTPVSAEGHCIYPTNIGRDWTGVNVRALLAGALGMPAWLVNDGDAAGYREYEIREAQGRHAAGMVQFITGTGLGGAIILNGQILAGQTAASELGHILTDTSPDADRCGCGAYGCAETRASLTGLAHILRHRAAHGSLPDALAGDAALVARSLRHRAQVDEPEEAVMDIWTEYFTHIGRAARSVCNTIGAGLVVLSGGAQEREPGASELAWQRFLDQGIATVRGELTRSFPHLASVKVEWAIDEVADGACYGAAAWAARRIADAR